jgi:hypothetical protein
MEVSEARRLRALEDENARLRRIIADLRVQNHILKEVTAKNAKAGCPAQCGKRLGKQSGSLPCAAPGSLRVLPDGAYPV